MDVTGLGVGELSIRAEEQAEERYFLRSLSSAMQAEAVSDAWETKADLIDADGDVEMADNGIGGGGVSAAGWDLMGAAPVWVMCTHAPPFPPQGSIFIAISIRHVTAFAFSESTCRHSLRSAVAVAMGVDLDTVAIVTANEQLQILSHAEAPSGSAIDDTNHEQAGTLVKVQVAVSKHDEESRMETQVRTKGFATKLVAAAFDAGFPTAYELSATSITVEVTVADVPNVADKDTSEGGIKTPVVVGASEERLWTGQGASNLLMEGGDWFTWGTREQWVIVDLRQLQAVHSVEFSMWGNAGNPRQIALQASMLPLGDIHWERVLLVDIPSASSTDYTAYLPQRTHARYWRVYLHNNWGGNWGMGLRRLQFRFEAQSIGHTHTQGEAASAMVGAEAAATYSEAVQVLGGMRRTDLGLLCLCTVLALMLIWAHISRICCCCCSQNLTHHQTYHAHQGYPLDQFATQPYLYAQDSRFMGEHSGAAVQMVPQMVPTHGATGSGGMRGGEAQRLIVPDGVPHRLRQPPHQPGQGTFRA
jgi:hypothetical protein